MNKSFLSVLLLGALPLASLPAYAAPRPALEKPNVIIVFLDDAGFADFSHTGNPSVDTPNLSRLAREGASFPQFYAASPACTASRYGLLTGRNPARSGFGTWVLSPTQQRHIHPGEVTIAEGLKSAGYATAIFGKWHLGTPNAANGYTPNAFPLAHGFDKWVGTNVSHDYTANGYLLSAPSTQNTQNHLIPGYEIESDRIAQDIELGQTFSTRYTDETIAFIRENKDKPFFVYLPHNLPHLAVRVAPEFQGRSAQGEYGDVIEELDYHVGRIRAALEEEGISENTLLIFTSDNGPWIRFENTASHAEYGEARFLIGSARPFRDGKGSTWEGGVRVPGIFWWPGQIAPNTLVREPASSFDILPTLFALAGVAAPADRTLDGRNILPYLSAENFTGTVPEFTYIYTGTPANDRYGARKGAWKIHTRLYSQTGNNYGYSASTSSPLLFNINTDPYERLNLSTENPAALQEVKATLDAFNASLASEGTLWD